MSSLLMRFVLISLMFCTGARFIKEYISAYICYWHTHTHAPPHTMTFEALKLRLLFAKLIKIAYLKVISMCKSSFKAQSNFLIILNFIKHKFGNVHARL